VFLNAATSINAGMQDGVFATIEFGFWDFDPGKKKKKFEEMIYDAP